MAKHRNKKGGSSSRASQPMTNPLEPSKMSEEEIWQELEAALAAGDDTRALEVLDAAPRWMKRQTQFMLLRATVLLSLGDDQQALQLFLEIERKTPRFTALYLPLAMLYMDRKWPAHALQAAKRAQSDRGLDDESRASLAQVIEKATASIQYLATKLDLPFETMQRACLLDEKGQLSMDQKKLFEADYFFRETIKITPNWNPPHNNRAQALYFSGKVEEAISVSEAVLARDAENIFALSSLVTYYCGLNRLERAREYAGRLERLCKKIPADSMEIEQVISALALVEDTHTLWKIAKSFLNAPSESLFDHSWFCLAVAAIRSGKWKEALKLMSKMEEEELSPAAEALLSELKIEVTQRQPRLAWMPPAYPGVNLFFQPKVIDEWLSLVQKFSGPLSPSEKRKLDGFFQKYPFIVTALKRLLWDQSSHQFALGILVEMDCKASDDEILRFALSQTGSQQVRMEALMKLVQNGRYTGPKIIQLWDEDLEEWRDVSLNTQRISEIESNARPETMALIKKAQKAKDPAEAISLLQKAVEKEPTSPIAVFNLGVVLIQNGREKEGEALLYHSVELDPNYTYGHASIALLAADKSCEKEALDHLEIVTQADVIAPDTAVVANMAWVLLAIQKHDLKTARQRFELASQLVPEHPLLEHYEKVLKSAEDFDIDFGFILDYQRKSARRTHQRLLKTPLSGDMVLRNCLEINTKEMLVGCAQFLWISPSGKKGELASRLAEFLSDLRNLQRVLEENLMETEREALQWILEMEGVRPWREFVQKYGDDMDESVYWKYHEPKSIPGRLRMSGLFYSGQLDGRSVAFIPADVRSLLRELLK